MSHIHDVFDTDTHFSIDPVSRAIRNESSNAKTKLVQYDHNSERFSFELPRYIDGHDMITCNVVQIHYINIGEGSKKNCGLYVVDDLQLNPDNQATVVCSWLVSQNATQYVGSLNFILRFICTSDGTTFDYVWNTAVYTGIVVTEGINNSDVIVEQYADVLAEWEKRIFSYAGTIEEMSQAIETMSQDVETMRDEIDELKEKGVDLLTFDLVSLGLPAIPANGTAVSVEVDTTAMCSALAENMVKFVFNVDYNGIVFEGASFVVSPSGAQEVYQSTGMLSWGNVLGFINIIVNETSIVASARDINGYMDLYMEEALGGDY